MKSESEVAQLCPTLCHLMVCSLPGSSARGIFPPRILEWVANSFCFFKLLIMEALKFYLVKNVTLIFFLASSHGLCDLSYLTGVTWGQGS